MSKPSVKSNMSRYFTFFALLALAAAYPAGEDVPRPITSITDTDFDEPSPWFRFPPFGNIFAPLTKLFSSFADIGPRIEVDDDKFRVIVNVKDYKKEDLKVKVKKDFILVQGAHEAKHDDHDLFASQFFHTYTLPLNASASDVTATLTSDGYLIVNAPINGADETKVAELDVPIVESGKPLKEDKEPLAPIAPIAPIAPVAPIEPVASADNVENTDKVEDLDKNVQNFDKVETLDTPVEPFAKVEADKIEAPVEPAVENAEVANVDKVENRNKEEEPQVTTEVASEAQDKEATTPAADREEVTVPQEIPQESPKVPQDNEVNEIQP